MKNCVNKNSKEVVRLAVELDISPATTAAKIGIWQTRNNSLEFPTVEDLQSMPTEEVVKSPKISVEVSPEMRELVAETVKEIFRKKGIQSEEEANKLFLHPTLIEAGYSFSAFEELGKLLSFIPASTDTLLLHTPLAFVELLQEQYIKGENFDKITELEALKQEYTNTVALAPIQGFSGAILPSGEFIESFDNFKKVLAESFKETGEEAFTPSAPSNVIELDENVLIENKKNLIAEIDKIIITLENKARIASTETEKIKINKKVFEQKDRKTEVQNEIDTFLKTRNKSVAEKALKLFEQDYNIILGLLEDPTADNIVLAKRLTEIFEINREPRNIKDVFISTIDKDGKPSLESDLETKELVKELNEMYFTLQLKVENALDSFIIESLKVHQNKLETLYPGMTIEQIKDLIITPTEDISLVEKFIFGQGAGLNSDDMFEQVQRAIAEQKEIKNTTIANEAIGEINEILPELEREMGVQRRVFTYSKSKVIKVLQKIFIPVKNFGVKSLNVITGKEKIYSALDYHSLFFRQDVLDNELISRFTKDWDIFKAKIKSFDKSFNDKSYAKKWEEANIDANKKFNLIKENAEFINLSLLHDLFEDPNDSNRSTDIVEAEKYKQEIISKIGEPSYEDLIKTQKNLIEEYNSFKENSINRLLKAEGVTDINALSEISQKNLYRNTERRNPFLFSSEFHKTGKNIFYDGKYSMPFTANYNSYIPRRVKNNSQKKDTNFYDNNFDTILNNKVYLDSWKVFKKSLELINSNLAQSTLGLKTTNIPSVEKLFKELYLGNSVKEMGKTFFTKSTLENSWNFFKGFISERTEVFTEDSVKTPGHIKNIKDKINETFSDMKTELNNTVFKSNIVLTSKTKINFDTLANKDQLFNILGITNSYEFMKLVPLSETGQFSIGDLRVFAHKKVLDNQTQDLPTVLKMLLEQSSIFSARVEAKQEIDILRLKEDHVDSATNEFTKRKDLVRKNAREKSNYFYRKAILMQPKSKAFGDISKMFLQHNSKKRKKIKNIYSTSFIRTHFYKNMSAEEKRLFNIYANRLETIDKHLERISPDDPNMEEIRTALLGEKSILLNKIDSLGESYTVGAFLQTIMLKTSLFAGMAYSGTIITFNYLNARMNFKTTGLKYFSENSVDLAWGFVEMNSTRHFNSSYEKEWNVLTHLIGKFNIIQDATNELQRAEKTHRNLAPELLSSSWITNPMYGTEFIEYYNQLPTVVVSLMNETIIDPETNQELPLFNGREFTAHEVVDGKVRLKDKFRTPENIAKFEDFTDQSSIEFIGGIKNIIRELNGDYSALGALYGKKTIAGQIIMLFKTWMGKKIESAYKYQRRNLTTGKIEDGYITGSLLNKEVNKKGAALFAMLIATGVVSAGALASGPFLALAGTGALGFSALGIYAGVKAAKRKGKNFDVDQKESLMMPSAHVMKDWLTYVLWETPRDTIKYPIKGIVSMAHQLGIEVPRGYLYDITKVDDLSEGEKNLKVLQQKVIANFWMIMMPLVANALLGLDDDEEELKGDAEEREYWLKKHDEGYRNREKKANFIKNTAQKLLDENNFEILPTQIVDAVISENRNIERGGVATGNLSIILEMAMYLIKDEPSVVTNKKDIDYGDTKLSSKLKKTFLPGIIRNVDKSSWNYGFETLEFRDKVDNAIMDSWDDTDYKEDKKDIQRKNKESKVVARDKISKEYYKKEYGSLSDAEKEFVDETVKEVAPSKKIDRKQYTLDQKKK